MGAHWRTPAGLHTASAWVPVEGELPSFADATGWLNSEPLTPAGLHGKVVLADFWTYTCINWLRQLPCLRAWAGKYTVHGLVVIGVHTPEFSFEHNPDNVRQAIEDMGITYPVATDNDYAVWQAFGNHYWAALYVADAQGRIRHHHFGEGEYTRSEMVIQQLLAENGSAGAGTEMVSVDAPGLEAPADWATLRSAENYTGYDRTENFASPGGGVPGKPHPYTVPARLGLNWPRRRDRTHLPPAPAASPARHRSPRCPAGVDPISGSPGCYARWPSQSPRSPSLGHHRERNNLPGEVRPQGEPAGQGHDAWVLRLTILPPDVPPNGTARRMGGRSRVRANEPVRKAMVEIFRANWNCPASVRQRHTGSDLGFCLRVELRTFSLHRKRSSDG